MGHNFTKVWLHRLWIDRNVVIGKGSPQAQQTKGRFNPCPSLFMHSSCAHQYLPSSHWAALKPF